MNRPSLLRRLLFHVTHPVQSLRHWWATVVYVYSVDGQAGSDRITARTGWPE